MGTRKLTFEIVAEDNARPVFERIRVAVIDARGNATEVTGRLMEFDVPEGVEWPALPEIGDDGRAHYMEMTGRGEAHCLPECWCQSGEDA